MTAPCGPAMTAVTCACGGPEEDLYVLRPAVFSARPDSFDFLKAGKSPTGDTPGQSYNQIQSNLVNHY